VELTDYLRVLRSHWITVVLAVLIGVAAAAIVSLNQPPVYQADASGLVSTGPSGNAAEASVGDALARSRAASYVDLATSRGTAQMVIDQLRLPSPPESLIRQVTVTQPLDTVLIKVSARASTPRGAQQLADAWVRALKAQVDHIENPGGQSLQALRIVPIESAALPDRPVSPRVELNLALGALSGLLAGVGLAVLRSQLDRRLRRAEDIERDFGVVVIGTIPVTGGLPGDAGQGSPSKAAGGRRPARDASPFGEAFLKLRTNLQFMDVDDPPRAIVVTSPLPADGKSTVAAQLARALSMSEQRVVLMDADLRRPTVTRALGLVDGVGLTDLLIGRVGFDEVAQELSELPNLRVLASGGTPPNPSELLGSQAMRRLLAHLAEAGYVTVIDTPPLLPVTDAAVLTASADGALVVIRAGKTLDTDLAAALHSLEAVSARALGVVLNRAPTPSTAAGYYGAIQQP
jgi:capsular exopolysaccharide synthesis family protein